MPDTDVRLNLEQPEPPRTGSGTGAAFAFTAVFGGLLTAFLGLALWWLRPQVVTPELLAWIAGGGAFLSLSGAAAAWSLTATFEERRRRALEAMLEDVAAGPRITLPVPTAPRPTPAPVPVHNSRVEALTDQLRLARMDAVRAAMEDEHALAEVAAPAAALIERVAEISRIREDTRQGRRALDDAARQLAEKTAQARTTARFIETQADAAAGAAGKMNDALGRLRWAGRDSAAIQDDVRDLAQHASAIALTASIEASRSGGDGAALTALSEELRELARLAKDSAHSTQEMLRESDHLFSEGEQAARRLGDRLDDFLAGIRMINKLFEEIPAAQREQARLAEPLMRGEGRQDDLVRECLETARTNAKKLLVLVESVRSRSDDLADGVGAPRPIRARTESVESPASVEPARVAAAPTPRRIGREENQDADPAEFLPFDEDEPGEKARPE